MLVIAHRGANKEACENSFQAFRKAVECGANRIELDVRLIADSSVVVFHDASLKRVTGIKKSLKALTLKDLRKICLPNREYIPLLDEVLDVFLPETEINIEVKGKNLKLIKHVINVIKNHSRYEHKIILSSFEIQPLVYALKHYQYVKRACLVGKHYYKILNFSFTNFKLMMAKVQTNIIHPLFTLVDKRFMSKAKSKQWIVYSYATMKGEDKNKEKLWSKLYELGVDGHCTNYPRELVLWLKDRTNNDKL